MGLTRTILLNTFFQIAGKIVTVLLTLATTILLTGYLGADGYGDYMYVLTLAIVFGSLVDWGTSTIGVRELAKTISSKKLHFNLLLLRFGLSVIGVLVLILASYFWPLYPGNPVLLRQAIRLSTLILFFSSLKTSFSVIFQAKLQMHRQVLVDILASLLIFLLSWFLIKSNFNFVYLLSATVIANLIAAILLGFWVFSSHTLECSFDFSLIKSLAKEALPMGAILILFSMVDKIDTLILGILKGNQAVGVYSLVYRVYDVLILGAAYLMNVMLPVFAQYTDLAQNKPKIQQLYQQCFRLLFFAGISLMFLTWIFAPFMVHVLTQQRFPEFLDAIPVLRLLSLAMFFSYFNHLTGYTLVAFGQQRKYLFVPVLALAFNILANFIFIPQYSYFASATITVATEIIVLFITTRFVSRLLGLKLWTSAN